LFKTRISPPSKNGPSSDFGPLDISGFGIDKYKHSFLLDSVTKISLTGKTSFLRCGNLKEPSIKKWPIVKNGSLTKKLL